MEEWIDLCNVIEGLEKDYYHVSNRGRVKRLAKTVVRSNGWKFPVTEAILKLGLSTHGYLIIRLRISEGRGTFRVHRLVALAFIENKTNAPEVNHKNGVKTDNTVDNLEWVTRSENSKHAIATGLIPTRHRYSNEFKQVVVSRYLNNKEDSIGVLSEELSISTRSVSRWVAEARANQEAKAEN